jgi:hypothetical protein
MRVVEALVASKRIFALYNSLKANIMKGSDERKMRVPITKEIFV